MSFWYKILDLLNVVVVVVVDVDDDDVDAGDVALVIKVGCLEISVVPKMTAFIDFMNEVISFQKHF